MDIWDYEQTREALKNRFCFCGKRYVFSGFVTVKGDTVKSIYGYCHSDQTEIEIPAERFTDMADWRI